MWKGSKCLHTAEDKVVSRAQGGHRAEASGCLGEMAAWGIGSEYSLPSSPIFPFTHNLSLIRGAGEVNLWGYFLRFSASMSVINDLVQSSF